MKAIDNEKLNFLKAKNFLVNRRHKKATAVSTTVASYQSCPKGQPMPYICKALFAVAAKQASLNTSV